MGLCLGTSALPSLSLRVTRNLGAGFGVLSHSAQQTVSSARRLGTAQDSAGAAPTPNPTLGNAQRHSWRSQCWVCRWRSRAPYPGKCSGANVCSTKMESLVSLTRGPPAHGGGQGDPPGRRQHPVWQQGGTVLCLTPCRPCHPGCRSLPVASGSEASRRGNSHREARLRGQEVRQCSPSQPQAHPRLAGSCLSVQKSHKLDPCPRLG